MFPLKTLLWNPVRQIIKDQVFISQNYFGSIKYAFLKKTEVAEKPHSEVSKFVNLHLSVIYLTRHRQKQKAVPEEMVCY